MKSSDITQFKKIYEDLTGKVLDDETAKEYARDIIDMVLAIVRDDRTI